jgi:uncharacterized damage-inducible protein DinB
MNSKELLLQEWTFTYDQEDWYPPLRIALDGVNAAQASWRPAGEAANTIWENVSHLLYYKERLLHRLSGTPFPDEGQTNEATFLPSGGAFDEEAWQATVRRMEEVHQLLQEKLAKLSEEELSQPLPVKSVLDQGMSLVLHDAYHTGQIVQLRKLQGSWPAQRS